MKRGVLMMEELIDKYYTEFRGLPNSNPIVRNNIREDAFVIAVLDILYGKDLKIDITSNNIAQITNYIVAPPDGGIDIFIEHEDGDDFYYDIIQVKYSELDDVAIKQCLSGMERVINDYLKDTTLVVKNLRDVISKSNFDITYKSNCTYYVVHKGNLNYSKTLRKNEKIITYKELEVLNKSIDIDKVPCEKFKSDSFNNYIMYEYTIQSNERALLCNLRGYDLAILSNKYGNTSIGKNILFGQNLRESLESKSKTYLAMKETIDNEPEKFWYYNNGITIIAEEFDANRDEEDKTVDSLELKNFSIINGAQTTSALGNYLKEAEMDKDQNKIEHLKKVFVLARILEVNKPQFRDSIAIYNNMQNPITTRDMVSNRSEQKRLAAWLSNGEKPNIYVEIRRGSKMPNQPRFNKHQRTTNEELAQLSFAAFLKNPFMAKDKKKSLFNSDYSQDEYVINEDYHKIFYYPENPTEETGILFKKSKNEIDELLFVQFLYKESKRYLKRIYSERIEKIKTQMETADSDNKPYLENQIKTYKTQTEISNICMFYCITLYYEFKTQFQEKDDKKYFLTDKFYSDNVIKNNLIKDFAQIFLSKTIEIIKKEAEITSNVGNWIRIAKSQETFLKRLRDDLAINISYETEYENFVNKYKA